MSNSEYFPSNFNVYRYDRLIPNSSRRYGGIAVLVHKDLQQSSVKLKDDEKCEFVAVEIKLNPTPLIIYAVYMRIFESDVAVKHVENIKELNKKFRKHRIVVMGDFNMNGIRWMTDESGTHFQPTEVSASMENFLREMSDLSFYQLSNITNKFNNVLDLVFVNELGDVALSIDKTKIIGSMQQDVAHVPYEILFEYCKKSTSMNIIKKEVICYKIANYERVKEQLG